MSSGTAALRPSPLIPLTSRAKFNFPSKFTINKPPSPAKICCSQNTTPEQQQLNLSVLRFTLGIPGLDESYLPRYIGYAFGTLLVLNHFVGSDSSSITPAQLRTEVLGLSLAAFSAVVPYLGKFLKLISVQDALCVRGYWNTPKDLSKENTPDWFREQIKKIGFSNLKDTMYFQQAADSELKEMVPEGTRSLLVQPIMRAPSLSPSQTQKSEGFLLLASSIDYAYTDKGKAWIAAIANKFCGRDVL
ncbi:UNVERIFIED_CONTAM: protein COFACTOR ASSEMBLY OF COMPLEX C SUBUNIT B CCB2, chloroplastic [Sesamum radiatum]|uniref:Protein COFACTOR ASSEMBLY OF COMPLEX C SUBUNIT B CCB2, chloroplastic n=1 Tax=Sesamum radiatum TaxID=300843 RepID=A0AAW2KEA6_SESRA